jgi:hypothetical protein
MTEIETPYIRISQEDTSQVSATDSNEHGIFCAKVVPPQPNEVSSSNWSWNLKDYVLDTHPDRSQQWFSGLHGATMQNEYKERRISMRYVHDRIDDPFKLRLLARVDSDQDSALEISKQTWYEIASTFPFEYILKPIVSEQDMLEETGEKWLEDRNLQLFVEVLQPSITTFELVVDQEDHLIPVFGKWKGTPTSSENIWRALHNYPHPVIMEVLLRAIQVNGDEIVTLDQLLKELQDLANNKISTIYKIYVQQWLDAITERAKRLAPLFLVQVRLASPQKILPYLSRIIGTALTYQSITNFVEPFGYQVVKPGENEVLDWVSKIASLDFIDVPIQSNIHPALRRIPFTASALDLPYITRLPLVPKGNIPNLILEKA